MQSQQHILASYHLIEGMTKSRRKDFQLVARRMLFDQVDKPEDTRMAQGGDPEEFSKKSRAAS
jgi:hypothetical protein